MFSVSNSGAVTAQYFNNMLFDVVSSRQRVMSGWAAGIDIQANEGTNPLFRVTYAGSEYPFSVDRTGVQLRASDPILGMYTSGSQNKIFSVNSGGTAWSPIAINASVIYFNTGGGANKTTTIDVNGDMRLYNALVAPLSITAGVATVGSSTLHNGDGSHTGFMEWYKPNGTRHSYMGYTNDNDLQFVNEQGGALKIGASGNGAVKCGDLTLLPLASRTPANNGELTVEATSNTTLTFKLKGSDGTVRSGTITLS